MRGRRPGSGLEGARMGPVSFVGGASDVELPDVELPDVELADACVVEAEVRGGSDDALHPLMAEIAAANTEQAARVPRPR